MFQPQGEAVYNGLVMGEKLGCAMSNEESVWGSHGDEVALCLSMCSHYGLRHVQTHTLSFMPPPPLFFSFLSLHSLWSTPCCLTVFITYRIPSITLSYCLFPFLKKIFSHSTPSRLWGCLSAQLDLPSFLFLCHCLQPPAHPTPRL